MKNYNSLLHSVNVFDSSIDNGLSNGGFTIGGAGYNSPSSNFLSGINKFNKTDLLKSLISRIAVDVSMVDFKHIKIDQSTGNQSNVDSNLIEAMTVSANIDQTGRAFIFDLAWSLLEEGYVAAVPVDTETDLNDNGSYEINSLRVGKIMQWYPKHVRVRVYDENDGIYKDVVMSKRQVVIIESPFVNTLRDTNQTLDLLQRKIKLMNQQDSNAASGKLNGFLQAPYSTRSTARRTQFNKRLQDIEQQMSNSKYGLAGLDANEKYIGTGGGLANNLLEDIQKLKQDFYDQTGVTANIVNGTASEEEFNVYYRRSIDPILTAIVEGFNRIFLTKTARSQGQKIIYYRDPFRMASVDKLANAADLFARNAIVSPNELRAFLGMPPHPDPNADKLYNRNIGDKNLAGGTSTVGQDSSQDGSTNQTESTVDDTPYPT